MAAHAGRSASVAARRWIDSMAKKRSIALASIARASLAWRLRSLLLRRIARRSARRCARQSPLLRDYFNPMRFARVAAANRRLRLVEDQTIGSDTGGLQSIAHNLRAFLGEFSVLRRIAAGTVKAGDLEFRCRRLPGALRDHSDQRRGLGCEIGRAT